MIYMDSRYENLMNQTLGLDVKFPEGWEQTKRKDQGWFLARAYGSPRIPHIDNDIGSVVTISAEFMMQ